MDTMDWSDIRGNDDAWSSLVRPLRPIPHAASAVHRITDADVAGAPAFGELGSRLVAALHLSGVLIAYNVAFDTAFLDAELRRAGLGGFPGVRVCLDPMLVARARWRNEIPSGGGAYSLGAVARRLGLEPDGALHRAAADAELAYRVLRALDAEVVLPRSRDDVVGLMDAERAAWDAERAARRRGDG